MKMIFKCSCIDFISFITCPLTSNPHLPIVIISPIFISSPLSSREVISHIPQEKRLWMGDCFAWLYLLLSLPIQPTNSHLSSFIIIHHLTKFFTKGSILSRLARDLTSFSWPQYAENDNKVHPSYKPNPFAQFHSSYRMFRIHISSLIPQILHHLKLVMICSLKNGSYCSLSIPKIHVNVLPYLTQLKVTLIQVRRPK